VRRACSFVIRDESVRANAVMSDAPEQEHRLRREQKHAQPSGHGDAPGGGLLLVHAHPDDECFSTGGLIARSIAEGRRVDLVTCTGGEEGEIHDPDLDPEEAKPRLREIRREELECSVRALGGGKLRLHLLGYRDSGMMGTPSNERADVFWRADLDKAIGRLVRIVREARPAVMVSYDANGNYGHPDHINAHRIAVGAWEAAGDAHRYGEMGLVHQVPKFYETAFNRETFLGLMLEMRNRGLELPWDFGEALDKVDKATADLKLGSVDPTDVEALRQVADALAAGAEAGESFGSPDADITTRVEIGPYVRQKHESMDCHRTQRQDFGWLLGMPDDLVDRALSTEFFQLTRWRDHEIRADLREDSVFSGL
jgi:N-acetyl-1-D-myo-inositol-2-amino-2-deoxy-alpha-D-glucopyranoside deacetylase